MGMRLAQQGELGGIDVESTVQVLRFGVVGGCVGPLGPFFSNSFLPLV